MSMNIDKPLDEIIATTKRSRAPRSATGPRGGGVGPRRGGGPVGGVPRSPTGPANGGARRGPAGVVPAGGQTIPGLENVVGDKIVISNLPEDVTEPQIKELFHSTIGPLKSASLSYDSKGKSKGIATVQFLKAADATKAYQQYNKRLVDGKRPMKVEIIVDPTRVPPLPLTSRLGVAPAVPMAASTIAAASGSARQPRNATNPRGGRGGRGGARAPRSAERPKATVESLDAEMSDYIAGAAKVAE